MNNDYALCAGCSYLDYGGRCKLTRHSNRFENVIPEDANCHPARLVVRDDFEALEEDAPFGTACAGCEAWNGAWCRIEDDDGFECLRRGWIPALSERGEVR